MTEQPNLPASDEQTDAGYSAQVQAEPPVAPLHDHKRSFVPWLYALGFVILLGTIYYVWQNPRTSGDTTAQAAAIRSLNQQLAQIDGRLDTLEKRPIPDSAKFSDRLDNLDAQISVLDGKVATASQTASQIDTLSGRIQSLSGRQQASSDETKKQIDALTGRVSALEKNSGSVDAVTDRLNRIAKIQEASMALASGRPIGSLPDAPEALARYADRAPPTMAKLRIGFLQAQQAAFAAKQPDKGDTPFIGRVWDRAQGLITIRQGNNVVVGDTSAVLLGQALAALQAGDLAAAVDAVSDLKGAPAQTMANWLSDAKSLLSARSALANMADHA